MRKYAFNQHDYWLHDLIMTIQIHTPNHSFFSSARKRAKENNFLWTEIEGTKKINDWKGFFLFLFQFLPKMKNQKSDIRYWILLWIISKRINGALWRLYNRNPDFHITIIIAKSIKFNFNRISGSTNYYWSNGIIILTISSISSSSSPIP